MTPPDVHRTIDALWRIESPRLIAGLARIVRDVGLAEDLAHDALVAALERWPQAGVPENPGAWLMATARRRAIDALRRRQMLDRMHGELGADLGPEGGIVEPRADVALTLRLIGGLTTEEIARAFLVPEPTVAQRIVRAKRTLAEKKVPYETPAGDELAERLASVLEVIHLVFNEGYAATSGEQWTRPELCEEALRLGRIVAELMPGEAEVHGLVSLMEIQASRLRARAGPTGEPILLLDQNRAHWDQLLIRRGLAALERGEALGGDPGPYWLQAAIAACHARARRAEDTDWARIAALYGVLARVVPSPIVELNRAVAVGMTAGPQAGLDLVEQLRDEPALRDYHLLPSLRGDLLRKLGRRSEARDEFLRAAALCRNAREQALLLERAAALAPTTGEAAT